MKERLISIAEICHKFNLTPYTINHYTNMGLLRVVMKKKNRRLYDEDDTKDRLSKILSFVSEGYPLLLISKKLNEPAEVNKT